MNGQWQQIARKIWGTKSGNIPLTPRFWTSAGPLCRLETPKGVFFRNERAWRPWAANHLRPPRRPPTQPGLRREPKTAPLEVMVIDHVKKDPTRELRGSILSNAVKKTLDASTLQH
jgi:hypothetical protein